MAVNLFVNRLYVLTTEGKVAYDETFHHGVNIIRGANSSGKSTITHLLFYGLGGDYTRFVPEVRRCSKVMVEVETDGATLTLSRLLEKDDNGRMLGQRGMTIYWGTLDEALSHNCESSTYGYKASDNRRSFSNVLFEVMGMPVVQGDSNITLHQLLRLLYVDQESPTSSLFLYEPFDSQTTRETVADLLLGIFDEELYAAKMRRKELESSLSDTKTDIRSLETTLSPRQRSSADIQGLISAKRREMAQIDDHIRHLRCGETDGKAKKSQTETLKAEVRTLNEQCDETEDLIDLLGHDIEDTRMFIAELERKQVSLRHSVSTRELLGNLRLAYCPECLSPLPKEAPEGVCPLCKREVDNKSGVTQAKRLISEFSFQKQESESILRHDEKELLEAKAKLRGLKAKRKTARRNLDELLGNVRSSQEEAIEDQMYRKGLLNGEILQYYTMLELAEKYEMLVEKQEQLEAQLESNRQFIQAKLSRQDQHRSVVMKKIQAYGVYFLHNDKKSQRAFSDANPSDFIVDFSNNLVYLHDRNNKYSASSSFFLKLVARFSLFFASLDIDWMRYPRFIFADNMEDKGIEIERAQKFQTTLIEKLKEYDTDSYQVIYTTSYITEELDHSEYVVGDHYTMGNKSLRNV